MSSERPSHCESSEPPRRPARGRLAVWLLILAAGVAVWGFHAAGDDPRRAWRGLLVSFLYFTPLAAGMVIWSAVVMLFNGRWAGAVERWALGGIALAPASLLAFVGLWLGRGHWATWTGRVLGGQEPWLSDPFLFARDLAGLLLLWCLAGWYVRRRERHRPTALGGWLAAVYAVVMTLLSFDLVMALDPKWYSTLLGGYFLVSGAYAGLAAWTIASLLSGSADADQRHDLGKLLVAFGLITTYMMYSQLLPIWYENLPREVRFVIPRLRQQPWLAVSAGLLAAVYLGPLALLLTRCAKRSPAYLGAVATLILAGLWVERWWLVVPTLGAMATPPMAAGGAPSLSGAANVSGVATLSGAAGLPSLPVLPDLPGAPELAIAIAFAAALALGLDRFRPRVFLGDPAPMAPDPDRGTA